MTQFDNYATYYEAAMARNLKLIPGGTDYYNFNRVRITKRIVGTQRGTAKILDFGAGVGLAIPHIKKAFPSAEISICDASIESTRIAHRHHPDVSIFDPQLLPTSHFDLVFVAGVVHHVSPESRSTLLQGIVKSLAAGGVAVFHELNPMNPVTRRLVASCPFDDDAILIPKSELMKSLLRIDGTTLRGHGYSVFLPPLLQSVTSAERLLSWCPVGAQYYVAIERVECSP
jgi:SAM-dependent methyltransferase